jgi:hypothetical protein
MSVLKGLMKMAILSTYKDAFKPMARAELGCKTPFSMLCGGFVGGVHGKDE